MGEKSFLDINHILDGDSRESGSEGFAVGVEGGRASGPLAATEHVVTDDEVSIGVDGFVRADHAFPPSDGVGVAAEGVIDQDGIA